jgi:hypothetical protein
LSQETFCKSRPPWFFVVVVEVLGRIYLSRINRDKWGKKKHFLLPTQEMGLKTAINHI